GISTPPTGDSFYGDLLDDLGWMGLSAQGDPRKIVTDPAATYWGAELQDDTLLPGPDAHIAEVRFADWLARQR
ncbi:hypothetical protein ABZX77_50110, partial [Streptomyces sp. NPDC004237]